MIEFIVLPLAGALAVAVKGGWVGKFWRKCPDWVDNHIPPVIILAACLFFMPWFFALLTGLACYVFKQSLGEEIGAVINNVGNNQYIDAKLDNGKVAFGREFGIKKAIQRGVMDGAAFSIALWNPIMLFAGLFFVPVYWSLCRIRLIITGSDHWDWAEPIYGLIFGLFIAISV